MSRRSRRNLTHEERELWQRVAETAKPIRPGRTPASKSATSEAPVPDTPAKPKQRPHKTGFRIGQHAKHYTPAHDLTVDPSDRLSHAPIHMDRKSYGQMTRGKMAPEARIDLHGMTLAQAHPALIHFVQRAHGDGKRLLLVITGKGKRADDHGPIPVRVGVLRHQVPQWLSLPPLGGLVLQVTPAHQKHGGHGAYYVFLRRQR